jgi:HAD superfamily phosphatase
MRLNQSVCEGEGKVTQAIAIFDIDGVIRDVSRSYRRALADTVEQFTQGAYRPSTADIDALKAEGLWNNDWEASRELVYRYFETQGQGRSQLALNYNELVAFFQNKYRGPNPEHWTGYICDEPLLVHPPYFEHLTQANIAWGFFSGATNASARYVLEQRLQLNPPVLIAMEDAPGKPDPTGLIAAVSQLEEQKAIPSAVPVFYVGDTVADMQTVQNARQLYPSRQWIGIGVLPPHAQVSSDYAAAYTLRLNEAGAITVFTNVEEITDTFKRHNTGNFAAYQAPAW